MYTLDNSLGLALDLSRWIHNTCLSTLVAGLLSLLQQASDNVLVNSGVEVKTATRKFRVHMRFKRLGTAFFGPITCSDCWFPYVRTQGSLC